MKTISNEILSVSVDEHGAELVSIKKGVREYVWQAYPEYWARHSPVLFPIVGALWNGNYYTHGETFMMGQHGFARDIDFKLLSESDTELWYELTSDAKTLQKYPWAFSLKIGYKLHDNIVDVMWKVRNTGTENMSFQIGAHPAFYYPLLSDDTIAEGIPAMEKCLAEDKERGFMLFSPFAETLTSSVITENGCVDVEADKEITLEKGYLLLDTDTFNDDALIFENGQVDAITLCDKNRKPYLTLKFDSPVVGIWSPPGKNAPFVCIEPWYGRTDSVGYNDYFEYRKWIQTLGLGREFVASYQIVIE